MTGRTASSEIRLRGVPLSPGTAVARVCMFNEQRHSNLPLYRVQGEGMEREIRRFDRAVAIAAENLETLRKRVEELVGKAEAGIFMAQLMIIEDETLRRKVTESIRTDGVNAESAVSSVLDSYEARLLEVDDEYIKERATDFGEVRRRLLDQLQQMKPSLQCSDEHCQKGKNRIIVAEELTPQLTVELDTEHLMGFVSERGGPNGHGAILARGLNIPAVSGLKGIRDKVACGMEILIDGATGEVVLWPREKTIAELQTASPGRVRMPRPVQPVPGLKVMANVSVAADVAEAAGMQAEGIGLYRTELDYIAAGRMLPEEELIARYGTVCATMDGHDVIFRLSDAGSDKPLPFLEIPPEPNPALGWRGARLLLDRPDILTAQARALAVLSRNRTIHVMYPMVVDLAQFRRLKAAFEQAVEHVQHGRIWHGIMLEVPSACLEADTLLPEVDFASIGTNDLIQYLFAVDRNIELVASDFRSDSPILWTLLEKVAGAARTTGTPLSVCGEMAADPHLIPRWLELGITTLSVSPRRISALRGAAEAAMAASTRELAGKAAVV